MQILIFLAGLAVYAWLLTLVHRQDVRKQLPWFACYVLWEFCATLIQLILWLSNQRLYFQAYWWMEAVEVALIVGAVRESFLRIFQGFTRIAAFRWIVWSLIASVVAYSWWKEVHAPPLQASRLDGFVFGTEFLFRWGIAGIAVLTTVLSLLLEEAMNTREDAVVTGFGVASLAFVLYLNTFSLFGQHYIFLAKYVPSVGYFLAAGWWVWVYSRPIEKFGFKELGMGPDDIRQELRRYREHLEEMRKKKWGY